MRFPFIPREEKFFDLFADCAANTVKAARMLKELVDNCTNVKEKFDKITEVEHAGDAVAHQIFELLHRTFVTPFDREDMAVLAHSLDDITDVIEAVASAMYLYKVAQPSRWARELADTIVQSAVEVEAAVSRLKRRAEFKQILEKCVEINRLENMADELFRSAIAELFENPKDTVHLIKWREIYELMESATDRCEDVSNALEGIVLKHA